MQRASNVKCLVFVVVDGVWLVVSADANGLIPLTFENQSDVTIDGRMT